MKCHHTQNMNTKRNQTKTNNCKDREYQGDTKGLKETSIREGPASRKEIIGQRNQQTPRKPTDKSETKPTPQNRIKQGSEDDQ